MADQLDLGGCRARLDLECPLGVARRVDLDVGRRWWVLWIWGAVQIRNLGLCARSHWILSWRFLGASVPFGFGRFTLRVFWLRRVRGSLAYCACWLCLQKISRALMLFLEYKHIF